MPQAPFLGCLGLGCPVLCLCGCVCSTVASVGVAVALVLWLGLLRLLLGRSRGALFRVASMLWLMMLPPVALATKFVPTSKSSRGCVRHR